MGQHFSDIVDGYLYDYLIIYFYLVSEHRQRRRLRLLQQGGLALEPQVYILYVQEVLTVFMLYVHLISNVLYKLIIILNKA